MAAYGSPTMSEETIWSSVTFKMPFHLGSAAALRKISFISSTVTFLLATKVMSAIEPAGTGTLMEIPSNFFSSSLTTRVTAMAAPVVEGTMFCAAARPRR